MGQGIPASQAEPTQSPAPLTLIPRSHEERERRYRDLDRILMNVLAVDASNTPATELRAEGFELTDNGEPPRLGGFSCSDCGQFRSATRIMLFHKKGNRPTPENPNTLNPWSSSNSVSVARLQNLMWPPTQGDLW